MRLPVLGLLLAALAVLPVPRAAQAGPALDAAWAAAGQGDWAGAAAAVRGGDRLDAALLDWRRLREAEDQPWDDYRAFTAAHPHWPGLERLRRMGEATIPAGADPTAVTAWFADAVPQTGDGALALVRAQAALGDGAGAGATAAWAWTALPMDAETETALAALGPGLDPAARAHALIWAGETEAAARMLPRVAEAERPLLAARLAVRRGTGDRRAALAALSDAQRADPALLADRFVAAAADGAWSEGAALLASRSPDTLARPEAWAPGRAQVARWLLREGRPAEARAIAAAHGLPPGAEALADLEWLAGFAALRDGDAPAAATHFATSEAAADGPISRARAAFWAGRAADALGGDGTAAYARAADWPATFYGLLALDRLGRPLPPDLAGRAAEPESPLPDDLLGAAQRLAGADDLNAAALFARKIGQTADRGGLVALARELGATPYLVLVAGKDAADRGVVVPQALFPLHPMANRAWPVPTELALAIARRESEFHPRVRSPAGAEGLMQLMPGTARDVSRDLGIDHAPWRLMEWDYNATLGTAYLAGLIRDFGTSPVLVAAGYNAGPGRPRDWIAQRGDPRDPGVDMATWIELIPFTETRIYVMRVAEAVPLYHARLTGETGRVDFTALLRGERPRPRPVARPVPGVGDAAIPVVATGAASGESLSATPGIADALTEALATPDPRPEPGPAPGPAVEPEPEPEPGPGPSMDLGPEGRPDPAPGLRSVPRPRARP